MAAVVGVLRGRSSVAAVMGTVTAVRELDLRRPLLEGKRHACHLIINGRSIVRIEPRVRHLLSSAVIHVFQRLITLGNKPGGVL